MKAEGTSENLMKVDEICDNMELFQQAASDTSFHASSTLAVLLATNPECKSKLIKEIDGLTDSNLENLDLKKLDSLEYFDACVKEGLRLVPPIMFAAPRRIIKNFKLIGKKIYKGDFVTYTPGAIHFSEEYFQTPEKYNPERFYKKKLKERYSYIPFATGPRVCVGMHFGEMVIKLITLGLFKKFNVDFVEGFTYRKTISPLQGIGNCNLILTERK